MGKSILEEKEEKTIPLLIIKTVATRKGESLEKKGSKHHNPQSARERLRNETFPVAEHVSKVFSSLSAPHGAQIHNPLQEFLRSGLLLPCHLSIIHLPTIHQS